MDAGLDLPRHQLLERRQIHRSRRREKGSQSRSSPRASAITRRFRLIVVLLACLALRTRSETTSSNPWIPRRPRIHSAARTAPRANPSRRARGMLQRHGVVRPVEPDDDGAPARDPRAPRRPERRRPRHRRRSRRAAARYRSGRRPSCAVVPFGDPRIVARNRADSLAPRARRRRRRDSCRWRNWARSRSLASTRPQPVAPAGSDASHPVVPHTTAMPRLSSAMTLSFAASGSRELERDLHAAPRGDRIVRTARPSAWRCDRR